ncbi:hypothetical protein GGH94_004397 [Coemansia aciculifera]|uniref:Uncharacterized protein n=1 Tax=Coemansia aciculifera TaxID=417176 RepID=A0A9W8IPB4_9FUNG|nr:hypothetical protein GGH94_004397 [Coemansia aciculifera]
MSTPPKPVEMASMPSPPSAPPAIAEEAQESYVRPPIIYIPEYINFKSVQRCLEDRRASLVNVNSATFSGELQLEKVSYQKFLVLERDHFTVFSPYYPSVKFSYKSRNAAMSHLWRAFTFTDMASTKFVEVDGLWQLEQLPVLCFVFGQEADTLKSSYLIDDNTIHEYYESETTIDMAELATVAQGKADLCVSHFFVVNRGKEYWAVDTKDPSISYTFGPSTKTRTISRLVDGSMTVQALKEEEQPQNDIEARTSQNPEFKLRDINGEEVVEGDSFMLHIRSERGEDEDEDAEGECDTMLNGKDWLDIFDHTDGGSGLGVVAFGSVDCGGCFGVAVIGGITYITYDGKFLQLGDNYRSLDVVVLPDIPSESTRIQISYNDDGDVVLSQWGTTKVITCEWIKASYGAVYLRNAKDISIPEERLRMRLIKEW